MRLVGERRQHFWQPPLRWASGKTLGPAITALRTDLRVRLRAAGAHLHATQAAG